MRAFSISSKYIFNSTASLNLILVTAISSSAPTSTYYGPYISSSTTTRKRHERASGGSVGDAGTSWAMG